MPNFTVIFSRSANKELKNLPALIAKRVFPKIESLIKNPRPTGAKKIQGEKDMWRIRVGDYRILYTISDKKKIVDIAAIMHRSDVYKNL
jgi:mRNA interferase RelE/StbE